MQITSSPHPTDLSLSSQFGKQVLGANKSNLKFFSSQLAPAAATNQQVSSRATGEHSHQFQQSAHLDSASSTTLVSQQVSPQEQPNRQPANNEEEEHSLESLSSGGSSGRTLDSGLRVRPMSKSPIPTIVVAKRDEAVQQKSKEFQQQQQHKENLKQASTSDYWSTVTTSSGDYYMQAHNMPSPQQQQTRLVGPYLAPANPAVSTRQPIMMADQDYYLEVAKASQQQANALNWLSAQPTGGLLQHNQLLGLDSAQQSICLPANLTNLVHTDLLSDMAAFQQQQAQRQPPEEPLREDDYDEDYAVPADESCRLDRSQVELVQMIGEGQKGYVFLGKLQSKDGQHISDVAIKTLKYETDQLIDKLMREAAMMRQLEHPHIIKFIGVCPETPALIAMELAEFGEVKQYLKLHKPLIYTSQLVLFTFQISTALSYLESKQYVHRDVAARNVLVCSHSCVKLADFGLSRNLQAVQQQKPAWMMEKQASNLNQCQLVADFGEPDKSHYVAATKGKLPVRWLAPESLAFRRFTSASDVWMFAVCSWELFQYGELRPWSHIRNNQVLLAIEAGQRLPQPANCPIRLYQLMLQCWSYAPVQRPKFRDLKQNLWSIYLNERAREQLEINQQQEQQRAILAATNWQNQDRIIQAINNNRVQQQKRLLEHQAVQNLHRINRANIQNQLTTNQNVDNLDQQQHSPLLASGAVANNTMTSNFSGYSSTTATAEHSNNSSRSSSMGSLARNQSLRAKQQKQLQYQLNQIQPPMLNNQSHLLLNKNFEHKLEDFSEKNQPPERRVDEEIQREKIDASKKRFQKTPGRALQKQRSQSSIIKDIPKQDVRRQRSGLRTKYGYDDHALLASSGHNRNTLLQVNVMEDDKDGDRDEDEDSSDAENDRIRGSENLRQSSQRQPPNEHHMRLLTGYVQHVRLEPAYEGINNREVSMIKGERGVPSGHMPGNVSWSRPISGSQKPIDSEEEMAKREQRLSETLQALKITPLKAKLSQGVRQSSLEPSGRRMINSRPLEGRSHNNSNGSSPSGSAFLKDGSRQLTRQQSPEEAQEDERQRLALHQRLLGRIRPSYGNKDLQRRSMNMENQFQNSADGDGGLANSKKVDQSLEILESLIEEKSVPKNKITPNDRKAHYQAKLLRDMNNNLQVELRHRLQSRRSQPKGFSFPDHEL